MESKLMRNFFMCLICGLAGVAVAAEPTVTVTSVKQNDDESVEVAYTLSGAAAVVTMSVLQNGVPIGDAALWAVEGDVNRRVEPSEGLTIKWHPDISWPGHKFDETSIQVKLRAWALDDTPDYMIVDLAKTSDARIRYYTSTNAIPMGLMHQEYRISKMVFRKIKAKGVTWRMGPDTASHSVTLDHNYYIGVFEYTAGQADTINGGNKGYFAGVEWQMRAVDDRNLLSSVRGAYPSINDCSYPNPPGNVNQNGVKSVLVALRELVGDETTFDFDLPAEAEWEFAARGGHGNGLWGDGSAVDIVNNVDANLSRIARYAKNDGFIDGTLNPYNTRHLITGPTNGVAIVGSYAPNSYGLYDMHGNVGEYCLDGWKEDITADGGAVISAQGTQVHPLRGGRYQDSPSSCLSGVRTSSGGYSSAGGGYGCRFCCHAGLK